MSEARAVLFVDHAAVNGGAERSLLLILERLDRGAWQPHLACSDGALAEAAATAGAAVHRVGMPRLRRSRAAPLDLWRGGCQLRQVIRSADVRVVVANTVRAAWYAAPAAQAAGVPFVWYRRDYWLGESRPRAMWLDGLGKRLLCAMAARLVANSRATAERQPCPDKMEVIPNGIDTDWYRPLGDLQAARRAVGVPGAAPVVGTVGRLRPAKGQEAFLRVCRLVGDRVPGCRGLIVGGAAPGDEGYATALRSLASGLGVAERVVFMGAVTDTRPAVEAMDVFVQSGEPEGFGLVNVEALAMERPVVAFRHGALPEIVRHGSTGLLVPPGDEKAMADAVVELIRDDARRLAMGQAARRDALRAFSIMSTVRRVERMLADAARAARS